VRAGAGRRAGRIGAGYFLVEGDSGRDLAGSTCGTATSSSTRTTTWWTYEVLKQEVTGMARTFSMVTVASPSMLLERARRAGSENGVALIGNERSGRFSHKMLRGEYRIIGPTVIVTITYKHRLVPWSVLEGRLRALFASASSGMARVSGTSTAPMARRTREGRRASRRRLPHRSHPHRR
jgi:hypothetical protein